VSTSKPSSTYAARQRGARPHMCITLSKDTLERFDGWRKRFGLARGDAIGKLLTLAGFLLLTAACSAPPSTMPANECPAACDQAVAPCETYANNECAHSCLDGEPCFTECEQAAADMCMSTDEACVAACPVPR
jgi:hypothetical protein